jgi:hypothetical protein
MQKGNKKIFPILAFTVVFVALLATPALAKDPQKKKTNHSSETAVNHGSNHGDVPKTSQHDEKPGLAWMTFGGTVKKIEGNTYTVEDYEGNQVKLYVGQGTKQIRRKKVGDTLRAEITRGGFANSIQ